MGFTRQYIKDRRFVLTMVRDGANDELLKEHVMILTKETEDMYPFIELADASELHDKSGFSEFGGSVSGASEISRKPHKKDKLAILVSSDEVHKLALSYGSTSIYFRSDVKIFRDYL
ncbi:MAG: hypothetical protein LJE83_08335 [Gammaproteobacteria bacterium]|nr:hypothetical protein [Gammaproteobacteria bacterium]